MFITLMHTHEINLRSFRTHASRVHFAKMHLRKIHFGSKKLGDGGNLLGDGVDLLGDGGDPRSIAGGSSKTAVAQKGDQRLEIGKCDGPADLRTDLHG